MVIIIICKLRSIALLVGSWVHAMGLPLFQSFSVTLLEKYDSWACLCKVAVATQRRAISRSWKQIKHVRFQLAVCFFHDWFWYWEYAHKHIPSLISRVVELQYFSLELCFLHPWVLCSHWSLSYSSGFGLHHVLREMPGVYECSVMFTAQASVSVWVLVLNK